MRDAETRHRYGFVAEEAGVKPRRRTGRTVLGTAGSFREDAMRTAFVFGLMATTGTAVAGVMLTQSDVSGSTKDNCVLAKATPTPSPTPKPSGSGKHIPKATLTARKTGGDGQPLVGQKKWGNIVLKRGADATNCPTAE
jgi:hypothetical protein